MSSLCSEQLMNERPLVRYTDSSVIYDLSTTVSIGYHGNTETNEGICVLN